MHISEDKLLEYALEIIDQGAERDELHGHLETCPSCRSRLKELQDDIDVISSIRPRRSVATVRQTEGWQSAVYPLLRAAALIVFGLTVGFGTSTWLRNEPAQVAPQYLTLSSPADSVSRYAASDATDVSSGYWREIHRDTE